MNFKDLKSRLTSADHMKDVANKIASTQTSYVDERYWKLDVDKATGNGQAVIRFMIEPEGEELPVVKLYKHNFKDKNTGKWYIEKSLTTLGEADPVSEHNTELWNTGSKDNQDLVKQRKRKLSYIANIVVVSDPKNPQNEGKVFLYEFGSSIYELIEKSIKPDFDTDESIYPFNPYMGANFRLRAYNKAANNMRSYDKSSFEQKSALFGGDDEKIEAAYNSLYSLQAEIAPSKFKTYDKLKEHFLKVIGESVKPVQQSQPVQQKQSTPVTSKDDIDDDYSSLLSD